MMDPPASPHPPPSGDRFPAVLRHHALLDGLPLGIAVLDRAGTIQSVNAEGARLLGGPAEHYHGQPFSRLWSQAARLEMAAIQALLAAIIRDGRPMQPALAEIHRGAADAIPVEWTCLPVEEDGIRGLAVSFRDISHERELQQDRNRLAAIADESPYPIIELDRHANLVYANPMMTELLTRYGYADDGFPRIAPRGLSTLVTQCLSHDMTIHGEEVRLPQASFSWIFCPVQANGHVRGYAVELTAVHRAQDALQQTADELQANNRRLDHALQEAHAATRTKAAFLATVSHELRTPMNGVIGMTSLLLETAMTPEQRTYANTIRQCGEALLSLIDGVLECSKIEAGKLELECLTFNLRATVDEVLGQFAERAKSKGLKLTGLVPAQVPAELQGDPARLRQVLTNLVGNAIKFTDRGKVTLHTSLDEDTPEAATIRFEIVDSGIGIHPNTVGKLFKPFVQADSSTTRKYGGTGLGLSISKQLVELMGGHIGVRSEPGRGSTFWCTARLLKPPRTESATAPPKEREGLRAALEPVSAAQDTSKPCAPVPVQADRPAILIVEDNAINQKLAVRMVEKLGYRADVAGDGQEALAALEGKGYAAIFMDCQMPVMDGFAATQAIRAQEARGKRYSHTGHVPIIAITANAMEGDRERCLAAGMDDYMTKPIKLDDVRMTLARWGTLSSPEISGTRDVLSGPAGIGSLPFRPGWQDNDREPDGSIAAPDPGAWRP